MFRRRLWDFVLGYSGLSITIICTIFGLASLLIFVALLGMDRSFLALGLSGILTLALLIFLSVKAYYYNQRDHGVIGSDFESGYEKPRKNLAKHQPDTLSEEDINEAIARIKKRKKR